MYIFSIIGVLFVLWIATRFFKQIGESLPVIELMLLIAGLQWIIGAFNSYRISFEHFKYFMRVDEVTFMSYVVPAFLGYTFVLLFNTKKHKMTLQFDPIKYIKYGRYIFFIGLAADVLKVITPSSLLFFIYLLSLFKFVGAGILLFSKYKTDRLLFYGILIYLLLISISKALFHDFILWGTFLFLIWALKNKPSVKKKYIFLMIGLVFITIIQVIKKPLREYTWYGNNEVSLELVLDIFDNSVSNYDFFNEENLSQLNVRLNQGWHISAIMNHIPAKRTHAHGATVFDALEGVLLPRILVGNKLKAGGRDNFQKYTGIILADTTSMGMSIVGEGYVNFGVTGGVLFMIIWGLFLRLFWIKLVKICKKYPLLIFFTPLIFLQVVKAETELYVVLNHLVKSIIVIWLFFGFSKKYLNWKI